ncbi:MAG: DUF1214 domain-containing protein [Alphaproteobacteria bacterium]|nr:DUF1214 domain-containing protein [Alphaproteobacteria bacterium]
MWFLLRLFGSIAIAIVLGLCSAYLGAFWVLAGDAQVQNGAWQTNLLIGSETADPYLRTYVALTGLLALNKSETIYYQTDRDSAGQPFDGRCSYRIDGNDPDARWWSITVYGTDHFLLPNASRRYSVNKNNVLRSADGSFSIRLSTTPEEGNWIATSEDGFELTLRLYNPGESVRERPDAVPLPSITKEACS